MLTLRIQVQSWQGRVSGVVLRKLIPFVVAGLFACQGSPGLSASSAAAGGVALSSRIGASASSEPPAPAVPTGAAPKSCQSPVADKAGFFDGKFTDYAVAALTFALVWVGIAQVLVYINQARLMRLALQATRRSNSVAVKAASAAELQARAAIGTQLPVVLSADPTLFRMATFGDGQNTLPYAFKDQAVDVGFIPEVELKNVGETPAYCREFRFGWRIASSLEGGPDYSTSCPCDPTAVLGAKGGAEKFAVGVEMRPTPEELDGLKNGTLRMWIYVSLQYADFIAQEHEARFCWVWSPKNGYHFGFNSAGAEVPLTFVRRI